MKFKTEVVLTAVTGINFLGGVSFAEFYDIMHPFFSFVVGDDSLQIFQFARVADECENYWKKDFGWMYEVVKNYKNGTDITSFVKSVIEEYGEYVKVQPIPKEDHAIISPVEEFVNKFPDKVVHTKVTPNPSNN